MRSGVLRSILALSVLVGVQARAQSSGQSSSVSIFDAKSEVPTTKPVQKTPSKIALSSVRRSQASPAPEVEQAAPRVAYPLSSQTEYTTTTSGYRRQIIRPSPFVQLEPTVGYTSSGMGNVHGINGFTLSNLSGTEVGATVLLGRGSWQFETGLDFAQRGFTISTAGASLSNRMNYLETPLLARHSFQERSRTHFFVRGGAVAAALLSSRSDYNVSYADSGVSETGVTATSYDSTEDTKNSFNDFDLRLLAGVGVNIQMSRNVFWLIEGDYQYGLTPVWKHADGLDPVTVAATLMTGIAIRL